LKPHFWIFAIALSTTVTSTSLNEISFATKAIAVLTNEVLFSAFENRISTGAIADFAEMVFVRVKYHS